jgi:hypothetical protein
LAGFEVSLIGRFSGVPRGGLISELRFYTGFLSLADLVAEETGTRSIREFAKYLLMDYVSRATGAFHDRETSGLVGAVLGSPSANEVAQRMWRRRNYLRLQKHFSKAVDFLWVLAVAISPNQPPDVPDPSARSGT